MLKQFVSKAAGESKPEACTFRGTLRISMSRERSWRAFLASCELIDHSNRYTPVIQCRVVCSIDGRVAIAGYRTILIDPRLEREIDSDRFGFHRAHSECSASYQTKKNSLLFTQQPK